jgi:dTDP-4-amino-4,6-dideoxygalactose transaminase
MRVRFAVPQIDDDDILSVSCSLKNQQLTNAGNVRAFEQSFVDFVGGGMALATTSCMGALHLASLAGLQPGFEVIVPALTHPATAMAVSLVGGVPVFIDCDKDGNITPEGIKNALTERTGAIFVVHYLGKPADMPGIMGIARQHNLFVVEDCALALGSFIGDTHVGLWGHVGAFSFYPAKHITTGEGGMFLTRYPEIAENAQSRRHFGQRYERGTGLAVAVQDWIMLGLNYRMTEMQGSLGVTQMKKLPDILDARRHNYRLLSKELRAFDQINSQSTYALSVFVGPDRDEVRMEMKRNNVETSVYYAQPVPHTKFYADNHRIGQFPNAEEISGQNLCFPVGPHLTEKAIKYMAKTFKEAL